MQWDRVVLPARFAWQAAGRKLRRSARCVPLEEGVTRVELLGRELCFYWRGRADNNLYFLIEQEFDSRNPHCYTTEPIVLRSDSRVFDVGACEGLFAFRLLKERRCGRVVCFEPDRDLATLIWRGAVDNGVADRISVEPVAAADFSGPVTMTPGETPDAGRLVRDSEGRSGAYAVRLDDYFSNHGIRLAPQDLIKIDAEGADLEAIRGAVETIERYRPQVAVTTYHVDEHVGDIAALLKRLNPDYRFRLKGFSHWTSRPRPVLLQASSFTAE